MGLSSELCAYKVWLIFESLSLRQYPSESSSQLTSFSSCWSFTPNLHINTCLRNHILLCVVCSSPMLCIQRSQSSATTPVKAQAAPPCPPAEPIAQVQPRSPSPAASTPTSLLPSQAVQDLLELGEKGLNLAAAGPHQGESLTAVTMTLHCNGSVF